LDELKLAAKEEKISSLKGFGKKTEDNILEQLND
jgi:DNA polymerase/3'-5' exonuclease PolX